jgi:methyl-accepting chemotaxis protein
MSEEQKPKSSLQQEFETLGKNIREALEGAWGSEERKRLSEEIERGLNEIGNTLGNVADDLQQNETVQKVSAEVDEIADQIRSGEVADKMRSGTVDVLQALNRELEGWIERWSGEEDTESEEA